jgi:hypothetical protein
MRSVSPVSGAAAFAAVSAFAGVCVAQTLSTAPPDNQVGVNGGVYLDLTGLHDVQVSSMSLYANALSSTAVTVELWRYPGSYAGHDHDQTGWTLHDSVVVISGGINGLVPMPLHNPLVIASGQTVGLCMIARTGSGLRYTGSTASPPQTLWGNSDLSLLSDRARDIAWTGTLRSPRCFAGGVHYALVVIDCYANCDGSTSAPLLNVADFTCFLQKFGAADPYTNCDGSTAPPILNVADFSCFLQKYAAGCP